MSGSKEQKHLLARLAKASKEAILTALALTGGLCLLAVLAGVLLDISLVVFRTGSMSPGINPGDIAVVREIPAASLRQGDVATVRREGSALPVTHRVVASEPDLADPNTVLLTMKGDANSSEDPVQYPVQSAKKVLFTAPGIGYWVMGLQNPWFMGLCSITMASLVTWTFWPRRAGKHRQSVQAGAR